MTSSVDLIPPLVPLPPSDSSSNHQSRISAVKTRIQADVDREANEAIDKFATLFSPATPRASPTLEPVNNPDPPKTRPTISHRRFPSVTSPDSEFGSFVSVPASEDPLSLFTPNFTFSPPIQPSRPLSHASNPSLEFFDKVAQDAKATSERNQRGLLDELLKHEDDPLYWLKEQTEPQTNTESTQQQQVDDPGSTGQDYMSDSLSDLDLDFFTSKATAPPPPSTSIPISRPVLSDSSLLHAPRSPPLPTPTLAPPLASTLPVSSTSSFNSPEALSDASATMPSSSYQSLSTLSSKWMASLLPPTRSSPPLTSLFADHSQVHRNSLPSSAFPPNSSSGPKPPPAQPHHASTFPFLSQTQTHHQLANPFASHSSVSVPLSGAPGFAPDPIYHWDKGFSTELERELTKDVVHSNGGDPEGPALSTSGAANSKGKVTPALGVPATLTPVGSIGTLMEKTLNGSVDLRGRRAMTVGVLDVVLADLIRPYLPALSRLPRTWNLLYSLDQHGISLRTLYAQCEPPKPKPGSLGNPGALVVIKDAGDAVFGAWMGDGIKPSKGFYGSGESFLWKYVNGKFEVFKWTGKNDYVALCDPEYISFGGGDGHYGIYLDDNLFDGSSARCPTFDNDPLCSLGAQKGDGRTVTFECVGLEIWGVGG